MEFTINTYSRPVLVLVGGFAGSGKTHYADIVMRELLERDRSACLLDKDTVERPLLEVGLSEAMSHKDDRESTLYLAKFRPAEYAGLIAGALNNLVLGSDVVISAPFIAEFGSKEWIEEIQDNAINLDFDIHWIWVTCSSASAFSRLVTRGAPRDTWKLANWDLYLSQLPWGYDETPDLKGVVRIDNELYISGLNF